MWFFRLPLPELLLRAALALSFLYPPIAALIDPYSWIGYFPTFLSDAVAPHQLILLHVFGLIEIVLAVWVLIGKRIRAPLILMAALLLAIVVANPGQFAVLFRDVAIALAALALFFLSKPPVHGTNQNP